MTRQFSQFVSCPHCGNHHTAESDFQRWVRKNKRLDSGEGYAVSDFDFIFHRFKIPAHGRMIQAMMFVEVKTRLGKVSESQAKTLSIARQLMQNRNCDSRPRIVTDGIHGPKRSVWDFGGFELRFSNTSADNSEIIEWNRKRIDVITLESLLRFDIHPVTFKAIDWRVNHHHGDKTLPLFQTQIV